MSDGQVAQRMIKGADLKACVDSIGQARICCVDVDVMIASAPEDYLDKKDNILVQKFIEMYSDEYITLNERISQNIFQVMGIKAKLVKEIYALIPSSKVESLVPYAYTIRSFLMNKQIDMTKPIIFVDDLGQEKLITVIDGLKFSRTRTINTDSTENILPDIKRSYINFHKKLGGFSENTNSDLVIITNNQQMAHSIKISDPELLVDFLDCQYPALEGLKYIDPQIKYRIHEEIIRERKDKEWHSRVKSFMIASSISLLGLLFFGFNQIAYSLAARAFDTEKLKNIQLKEMLEKMDQEIYRDALRQMKGVNYSLKFFEISNVLPSTYDISTFKFTSRQEHWIFDAYLFAQDDQFYDEIPRIKILKKAEIKDFFIKDHPGKYLKVAL